MGRRTYGVVAAALLCLGAPAFAADLVAETPAAAGNLLAVPVTLWPGAGESVASLQVDVVVGSGYALHSVEPAAAATAAGKEVVFAQDGANARLIIAGFNQRRIDPGAIATVYLAPESGNPAGAHLRLEQALAADAAGKALPVTANVTPKSEAGPDTPDNPEAAPPAPEQSEPERGPRNASAGTNPDRRGESKTLGDLLAAWDARLQADEDAANRIHPAGPGPPAQGHTPDPDPGSAPAGSRGPRSQKPDRGAAAAGNGENDGGMRMMRPCNEPAIVRLADNEGAQENNPAFDATTKGQPDAAYPGGPEDRHAAARPAASQTHRRARPADIAWFAGRADSSVGDVAWFRWGGLVLIAAILALVHALRRRLFGRG
ncbi:MAG: hypothetical protein ACLFTT_11265 [Candidatus Hydrogenedentota bacterium]